MDQKVDRIELIILTVIVGVVLLAASYFIPWENVTWGRLKLMSGDTVTVVGEAKTKQKTQKAMFSAGVSAVSDNKDVAVSDVNKKTQAIIDAVKTFGVTAEDIKTQNININQNEETYYEDNRQKIRPGQWRVNNTVEITLANVDKASDLAALLTNSGATNIYGPNFTMDDTGEAESALFDEALKNAKDKATRLAAASGRKLGKVVNVVEGYQPQQTFFRMEGGGGGGGIEPGTGTVSKSVTVTYQLR
jgi:uncharacterized protein